MIFLTIFRGKISFAVGAEYYKCESLNERIRTTKDATRYPSEVAYYLRNAMFYVT